MSKINIRKQVLGLLGWLTATFLAAVAGGAASVEAGTFYTQLTLPGWAPPGWVFGPVWSLLYLLMAVAAWMVWREGGFSVRRGALILYLVQLAANALWTWLFFAWRLGAVAFVEILILWVMVIATGIVFWRVRRLAGILLIPYWLWISFAAALAYRVWQLNPDLL